MIYYFCLRLLMRLHLQKKHHNRILAVTLWYQKDKQTSRSVQLSPYQKEKRHGKSKSHTVNVLYSIARKAKGFNPLLQINLSVPLVSAMYSSSLICIIWLWLSAILYHPRVYYIHCLARIPKISYAYISCV